MSDIIILDQFKQGTPEWFDARCGVITGSELGKIITPSAKPSSQADEYMDALLHEWQTGQTDERFYGEWMKRGHDLEDEARAAYELETLEVVEQVGIVYQDDRRLVACSPDGLRRRDRIGQEIKCPKGSTWVKYWRSGELPDIYKPQVQGSLAITGYDRWDFIAYHPAYRPLIIEVRPDPVFHRVLASLLDKFIDTMLERREALQQMAA